MRAAVIGGSLGGLAAALLLHELGVAVDVYERRSQFDGSWGPGAPELIFGLRAPGA